MIDKKILQFFEKAMKAKGILKDTVVKTLHDDELGTKVLILDLQGYEAVIKEEEVDAFINWKSLVRFVGREISFVIDEIDKKNGIIYCSRRKAQEMLHEDTLKKLQNDEEVEAVITGFVKYGAYIEMDGTYGLIKNVDFSDDYIAVSDVLKIDDRLMVKLNKISKNDKITVEPVEKYVATGVMSFDTFEKDQVVLGQIASVKPWGAYVNLGPGVDALCSIPETFDIEEGLRVSFRITVVKPEEKRVRGKILKVL